MAKRELKILSKDAKDLRHRILFTLFCLGIYCLGTGITIVWATPWLGTLYGQLDFLGVFNLMSGGGFERFSIFGLGVTPYINASIVTQLLTMDIIPYFKELKEQGYVGMQKINRITRYLGIALAFVQAYVLTVFLLGVTDVAMILKITLVMTAGTSFLLWLGDRITMKGIGNGQSLLIMASIVLSLPAVFTGAYELFIGESTYTTWVGVLFFIFYLLMYLLVIVGVVWITLAERKIPIQYANKTVSAYGAKESYLPLRINYAGVMPVIFASMLLTIPSIIVNIIGNQSAIDFVNNYIMYTSWTGFILYIALIIFFSYFYTFMAMNPEEMSKNLNKSGAYIPGVRPGAETTKYISTVVSRLTLVGSLFIAILAGLPILVSNITGLDQSIAIGGTGILIVVGVAIETYKQIQSGLVSRRFAHRSFK
ncbi:TPA: preprotein translocase subunit SecY [Candidatus Ventrenecus stercoripullorum]|nr:preprotein translocase subunit SecY [Candidatus Ventrenecus stercoripullorum]